MGIVASQSFKNVIFTYLGFLIGAVNTLFLYTKFLGAEYYGLVGYVLSLAFVIMPLMAFGANNTLVRFYSSFKTRISVNSFLTLMLFLPLALIVPICLVTYCGYGIITGFLSEENTIIKGYLWHTIIIAISLAYFEVFFAWAKVQMKTVFGNFMKEVFHRAGVMILLFMLYFNMVDAEQFMVGLVLVYVIRMVVMKIYAFGVRFPVIAFKHIPNLKSILQYSFLIIIAASVASVLLDIDKVMLGYYVDIKQIAYYNVAVFIAMVIAVPQRSMHQILMPLSARFINENNITELSDLYKRSSLTLFIVSGFIFLLIILNINELYHFIPEEFNAAILVVLLIGLAKLYDAFLGSNNAILFNSNYYVAALMFGVVLVVFMIVLNIVLIPVYGINGAAFGTFVAVFLYNSVKLYFVYKKFKILPFTVTALKTACLILVIALSFYFWDFPFHPVWNIVLKSVLIGLCYFFVIHKFRFSENISSIFDRFVKL
ncbi:MAG: polysaccharide biosynthesis C-terminal domain-containing protein [Aestuariibaculum sp.]